MKSNFNKTAESKRYNNLTYKEQLNKDYDNKFNEIQSIINKLKIHENNIYKIKNILNDGFKNRNNYVPTMNEREEIVLM